MPRNKKIEKRISFKLDPVFNNCLLNSIILLILRSGKRQIAENIVYDMYNIIEEKTKKDPLSIIRLAIINASPKFEVRIRKDNSNKPRKFSFHISKFKATKFALNWIIKNAKKRTGIKMALRLAFEIIDTSRNNSNTIKNKERLHQMAKSYRFFKPQNKRF